MTTQDLGPGEEIRVRPRGEARVVRGSEVSSSRMEERVIDDEHEVSENFNLGRDRVRWGPIVAGLLTALTTLLLLGLLGVAIGLTTVNAGTATIQGGPPPDTGRNSAIWAAISSILAFLAGGYVAARMGAIFNRGWGAMNGALVFMLAVPLLLWLAGQGVGAVLGTLGSVASGLNVDAGNAAANAANAASNAANAAQNDPAGNARRAEALRNGAWGTLLGSLLGLGASALGGWLGTRKPTVTDRVSTTRVRERTI